MRKLLLTALCFAALTVFPSCNEEKIVTGGDSGALAKDVRKGEKFTLNLTVDNKTDRSFLIADPAQKGKPQILWTKGDSIKLKCILYCPQHPEYTTYGDLKGVITKGSTYVDPDDIKNEPDPQKKAEKTAATQGQMSFNGTIQLKDGDLSSGDWYIQAFIGGDSIKWNDSNHSFSMPKQVVDVKGLPAVSVPLASEWAKLVVHGKTAKSSLSCKPLGCLVSFVVSSPLYDSIKINKIQMENNIFDDRGTFSFKLPSSPGSAPTDMPAWTSQDNQPTSRISLEMKNLVFKAGTSAKESPRIYFWGMPRSSAAGGGELTGYVFISNDNSEKGLKTTTVKTSQSILSGNTYRLNFKLPESDLMITEFFHNNPGGNNNSMIELYNPTKKTIDLTEYALVRERAILKRTAYAGLSWGLNEDGKYIVGGFQPGDQYNIIDEAMRQDIYIADDSEPVRMLGGQPVKDAFSYGDGKDDYKNRHRVIYTSGSGYSRWLAPGKTAVLCASHYMNDGVTPETYVGKYIKNAINSGDCQFVVAVNNGIYENGDYQYTPASGTMDHGVQQVMVLCKKNSSGLYRPIDATGPLIYYGGAYHPEINKKEEIIQDNKSKIWCPLTRYKTIFSKKADSLHICDGGATGTLLDRANRVYDMYDNFLNFMPNVKASAQEDWYDLVRKKFALYPTTAWDNNKQNQKTWDEDSQWILVRDKCAGASLVSSMGTRTVDPAKIDYTFLDKNETSDGKYYLYFMFPISYNDHPYNPGGKTGYNVINNKIVNSQ